MTSREENLQNTSQSSDSGTTGPGSFLITNGYKDFEMEDSRDEPKSGSCVDQGADNLEPPRALYTAGDELPRTDSGVRGRVVGCCSGAGRCGRCSPLVAVLLLGMSGMLNRRDFNAKLEPNT